VTGGYRNRVAIAGYAQSDIVRHADRPLGALTVETARRAIADTGLRPDQIDGFTSSALVPAAGSHAVEDGIRRCPRRGWPSTSG
jgi:3-oxoacyl-[acyl-carrier-protein] synthase III